MVKGVSVTPAGVRKDRVSYKPYSSSGIKRGLRKQTSPPPRTNQLIHLVTTG